LRTPPAHLPLCSVSMIKRLRGVAEASETKEMTEYLAIVPSVERSK